jgi:branched-chain amino acid transport system permease protein
MLSPYIIHLVTLIAIYAILAMAFNLAMGYTGILNFGHIALFGIGAYISAILTTAHDVPFLAALVAAMAGTAIVAAALSVLVHRVRGDFMALISLLFAMVVFEVFVNFDSVTRGALGIPAIPRPFFAVTQERYALFVLMLFVLSYLFLSRVTRSPFGLVLGAVRDDEVSASVLGKNVAHVKRASLVLSGAFAGLAGSLFAHFVTFIDPSSFYLIDLVAVVTAVVIGGLGSLEGSIVGVVIYFLLPEGLRYVDVPPEMLGAVRQIIFSVLLLLIIIIRPKGIFGKVELE